MNARAAADTAGSGTCTILTLYNHINRKRMNLFHALFTQLCEYVSMNATTMTSNMAIYIHHFSSSISSSRGRMSWSLFTLATAAASGV